jgi:hypothetical protein
LCSDSAVLDAMFAATGKRLPDGGADASGDCDSVKSA